MNETENIMNIDEVVEEKPYVLRDLKSEDMFPMFRILSKIGFKEFKTCFDNDSIKALIADAKTGILMQADRKKMNWLLPLEFQS